MRVLFVSANFRPSIGGIERFVETLADGLAARGHEVTVATCRTRGAPEEERAAGVRVVRMPASDLLRERLNVPYPVPRPRASVRILRDLISHADVVHTQDALYLTTVMSLVIAQRLRIPTVLTQHVAFVPQKTPALDLAQHAAIATLGRSAKLATVVTAYNPDVAGWAQRRWRVRAVRLLPIGVLSPPTADRGAVRRELGLPEERFFALFSGRDVPKKRLDVFLAARDPAYQLVAVTDRSNGGSRGARLLPFTSPERFGRLLAAADAFVLPSEGEGFPLALQEALVAGIPCVVTRGPGYEHFLADDDVIFVPPSAAAIRDALRRLASDRPYARVLAERARAAGERAFGAEAFVDAYEGLYRGLVASQ